MLKQFQIADYPHLKAKEKSRIHKDMYKLAYPDAEKKSLDAKSVAAILGRVK